MEKVNVTELRDHLPDFLERAHVGEELAITSRGKVIARLMPPKDSKTEAQQQLKSWRKKCKVGDIVSPVSAQWKANRGRS